jgi:hypothetical protein
MTDHEATVKGSARRVRKHKAERDEHIAHVLAALRDGEPPTQVADWSAFSAAYVRKLARDAGIPPAEPFGRSSRS